MTELPLMYALSFFGLTLPRIHHWSCKRKQRPIRHGRMILIANSLIIRNSVTVGGIDGQTSMEQYAATNEAWREKGNAAFTLVELLVVLGVLGLLISLLLPALASAKRKAHDLLCKSNLRQHGLAIQGFVADHGIYPLGMIDHEGRSDQVWHRVLHQHLGPRPEAEPIGKPEKDSVWHCPAAIRIPLPREIHPSGGKIIIGRYGFNRFGLGGLPPFLGLGGKGVFPTSSAAWPFPPAVGEADIKAPSQMIAMGDDIAGWKGTLQDGKFGRVQFAQELFGSTQRGMARHKGKMNLFFCDGRVEALTLKLLYSGTSDAVLSLWNRDHEPHRERL